MFRRCLSDANGGGEFESAEYERACVCSVLQAPIFAAWFRGRKEIQIALGYLKDDLTVYQTMWGKSPPREVVCAVS